AVPGPGLPGVPGLLVARLGGGGGGRFPRVAPVSPRLGEHPRPARADVRRRHHRAALPAQANSCTTQLRRSHHPQRTGPWWGPPAAGAPGRARLVAGRVAPKTRHDWTFAVQKMNSKHPTIRVGGADQRILRRRRMSQMLASTLRRPVSQARPMLAGSRAIATRSSLFAVNRAWAGGSEPVAPRAGDAPSGAVLVTKVTPRSESLQLITRSTR